LAESVVRLAGAIGKSRRGVDGARPQGSRPPYRPAEIIRTLVDKKGGDPNGVDFLNQFTH
jgi:hypothetical protein